MIRHPSSGAGVAYSGSGLQVEGSPSDNICVKAYQLLRQDFPQLPPVKMHLHKTIPMGAGLGGGSADGAFTLMLLNKKFNLGISEDQLIQYALQLGSDCPFFLKNTPCYATGRGELMEEAGLDLSAYKFAVVYPGIHVNTGWAFSQIKPVADRPSLKDMIHLPVALWKGKLTNDFEGPVSRQYPAIAGIKQTLYQQGALYAAMTGSGSTVYGLFEKEAETDFAFPPHYFVKIV